MCAACVCYCVTKIEERPKQNKKKTQKESRNAVLLFWTLEKNTVHALLIMKSNYSLTSWSDQKQAPLFCCGFSFL